VRYKIKLFVIFFSTLIILSFNTEIAKATVILADDFEYAGGGTSNCTQNEALSGWKWKECRDRSTNAAEEGWISVSTAHAHTGTQSLLMNFLPYTWKGQTNLLVEKNAFNETPNHWGPAIWISMWIYPAYEPGMYSKFDGRNKWIYSYPQSTDPESTDTSIKYPPGHWCIQLGTRRYTGTMSFDSEEPFAGQPDEAQGLFAAYSLEGCANGKFSGHNLANGRNVYMPLNTWSRLVMYVNSSDTVSPNAFIWIDNGSGRLVKVGEHTLIFGDHPAADATGTMNTSRIKIGTTFPAPGGSYSNFLDSWIFVDDVVFATSSSDIDFPPNIITNPN